MNDHPSTSRRSWLIGLAVSAGLVLVLTATVVVAVGLVEPSSRTAEDFGAVAEAVGTGADSGAAPALEGSEADRELEEPLASWRVDGDELVATAATMHAAKADSIWDRFAELVPSVERQMVVRFELLDADYEGAFVYPTEEDPSEWVLGVSIGLGEDLDSTLVHEFGHLLTLGADEVPPGGSPAGCATYFTGEGCALDASTFARYVDTFWSEPMISEALRIEAEEDWDAFDRFYELHADDFVTDYASTNPGEDLAETFMVFVLEPRPSHEGVAADKVLFLWQDPEMVELREEIRADL